MDRVRAISQRPNDPRGLFGLSVAWSAIFAGIVSTVLTLAAAPSAALAQDSFSGRWVSAESDVRPTRRAATSTTTTTPSTTTTTTRAPRRSSITTTTVLEDFDVPRRAARSARATTRVVTRQAQPRRTRVASLSSNTTTIIDVTPPQRSTTRRNTRSTASSRTGIGSMAAPLPSLTGGGIAWRANASCLAGNLRSIMSVVASRFGGVTVNSTCRSRSHNRRVGGASRSWHLTGNAVDFRVHTSRVAGLAGYLRSVAGGFKHYGGGRFHIDNGPKRSF